MERTVGLLNDYVINVTDYGAVGDGVADDTNAIKQAVHAVNTKGGYLYFPTGYYRLV